MKCLNVDHDTENLDNRWRSMVRSMEHGDTVGALYMLKALANDGVTDAMTEIGVIYETGSGPIEEDVHKAIKWYQKAEAEGDIEGKLAMARLRLTGQGLPVDYQSALESYQCIIQHVEDRRALFALGWIYHKGFGVHADICRAEDFYTRAIAAGHLLAPKWYSSLCWSRRQYLKSIWLQLLSIIKIWYTTIFDRKSLRLHRQL